MSFLSFFTAYQYGVYKTCILPCTRAVGTDHYGEKPTEMNECSDLIYQIQPTSVKIHLELKQP